LVNPGKTNVWNVYDTSGNLRQVTVTREAAGFPKLKRNYSAVEFNLERPFDGSQGQLRVVAQLWHHRGSAAFGPVA
jgi:hypothetical protein